MKIKGFDKNLQCRGFQFESFKATIQLGSKNVNIQNTVE